MFLQLTLFFAVLAITLVFAFNLNIDKGKLICVQCVTVVLACFSGFRSWRYGDLMHYCYVFLETNLPEWKLDIKSNVDTIGLQLLYRAFGQLGFGFETLLFFVAAFCAVALGILVYRYSSSPYFSYLMYISLGNYVFSFSALKQAIASAFIMLAFVEIIEKRPVRFTVLVLLAFLFHKPAILFLAAYFIANKKIDKLYFAVIAIATVGVMFFIDEIVTWLSELYYDTMEFEATDDVGFKQVMMVAIIILAVILRQPKEFDRVYKCTFGIMLTAAILQAFAIYDNVFTRLADYYFQFFVIFVPLMLETGDEQIKQYPEHADKIKCPLGRYYPFLKIGITVFAVFYYIWQFTSGDSLINDFKFVWQDTGETSRELLERFIETGTLS